MDNAVALVRAYLQLNGYFTITEYPVVRRLGDGTLRTLTEEVKEGRAEINESATDPES